MAAKTRGKRKGNPGLSNASLRGILMGGQSATVRSIANNQQWNQIVRAAKQKGLSVEDFLNNTPTALAPKNRQQIINQAKRTVSAAYAPAETELGSRESQLKAIRDKRERDSAYYRDWINQTMGSLGTDVQSANKLLSDKLTGMDDAARTAYAAAATNAARNVNATPGTVSDLSTSNAINSVPV